MSTAKSSRLLLVEDEPALAGAIEDMLKGENYLVERAEDGILATDRILRERYDLVVLDVMLPGMDGFEVCARVRKEGIATPILILTARGRTSDKVHGLQIGADDYLAKPFDPAELLARIQALLRRAAAAGDSAAGSSWFKFGDVSVDFAKERVYRAGTLLDFSEREYSVLKYLIDHRGATVSRDRLLIDVWGYNGAPVTRTVDVHIALLRQKLERDPKYPEFIHTVHMQGYRFIS
jgi:two-component system, OmpR family, alkaline phosphatase synthesis response regulator PhoP